jgi:hypothetical protein
MYIHIEGTAGLNVDLDKRYSTYEEAVDGIKEVLGSLGGFYDAEAIAREVIVSDFERSGRHSLGGVEYFISPGIASVSPEQVEEFLNQHLLVTEEQEVNEFEQEFAAREDRDPGRIRTIRELRQLVDSLHEQNLHLVSQLRERDSMVTLDMHSFQRKVVLTVLGYATTFDATEIGQAVLEELGLDAVAILL